MGTCPGSPSLGESEERDEVFKSFSKLSLLIFLPSSLPGVPVTADPWETGKWLEPMKYPKHSFIILRRVMER